MKLSAALAQALFVIALFMLVLVATRWGLCETCQDPISRAQAQGPRIDRGLMLARLVVHEAGGSRLDHEAIHQTLRNMGGGRLDFVRGPLLRIRVEEDEGRWPRRLNRAMDPPLGWPETKVPWNSSRGRGRAERVLAWADRMVDAERWPRPCSGTPITWGGRCEDEYGACDHDKPGYVRVSCGPTLNYFAERAR